jgi:pimeloyl-ACP methyl ester carboxylesterase
MSHQKANVLMKGKGSPVVLLHSSLSSKLQWYSLMESMSSDYLVIAVDLYGCGDSPFPDNKETFGLSDEVTLVESLLADIIPADGPIHLVGHSYGGAAALRFCYKEEVEKRTQRIRSLALFEPVAFHLLPETEEALAQVYQMVTVINSFVEREEYASAAEHFVDYWNKPGTFKSYPEVFRKTFSKGAKKLPLDFQALLGEPLSLEDYSKIKRPVCLMTGRQSPLQSRRVSELLADTLTNCQLKSINGDHMAPIYQAEDVNPIIRDFIK